MSVRSLALKKRLRAGETTFGGWLTVANPVIAEIMAGTGFDWVVIDTEHGGFDNEGLMTNLIAFNGSPTRADRARAMERRGADQADPRHGRRRHSGADGEQRGGSEGRRLGMQISAGRAPAASVRAARPTTAERPTSTSPRRTTASIVILQIEHVDAVAQIDAILDTPGIDVVCLGPTDLSGSAGVLRQFEHPIVVDGITKVLAAAKKRKMPACLGVIRPDEETRKWKALGRELHGHLRGRLDPRHRRARRARPHAQRRRGIAIVADALPDHAQPLKCASGRPFTPTSIAKRPPVSGFFARSAGERNSVAVVM